MLQRSLFLPNMVSNQYIPKHYPIVEEFAVLWASTNAWKRYDVYPTNDSVVYGNTTRPLDTLRLPYKRHDADKDLVFIRDLDRPTSPNTYRFPYCTKNKYGLLCTDPGQDNDVYEHMAIILPSLSSVMVVTTRHDILFVDMYSSGGYGGHEATLISDVGESISVNVTSFTVIRKPTQWLIKNDHGSYKINTSNLTITDMLDNDHNCTSITPDTSTIERHRIELAITKKTGFDHTPWGEDIQEKKTVDDNKEKPMVTHQNVVQLIEPPLPPPISAPNEQFLRDMMLQCLDDMCQVEYYLTDDEVTNDLETMLPTNMKYLDTHVESMDDMGFLTFFRMQSEGALAASCVLITANTMSMQMSGNNFPSLAVTVLKGVIIQGLTMLSKIKLSMLVSPFVNYGGTVVDSVITSGNTISNNVVTLGNGLTTNLASIGTSAMDVVIVATQNGMMLTKGSLVFGGEMVGVLKGWSITKLSIVGGSSYFLTLNTMIGLDRLVHTYGPESVRKYGVLFTDSGHGLVYETSRVTTDLFVDGLNNINAGFHGAKPFSPQLKEDIKTLKTAFGGSALLLTGLALAGIIIQQQGLPNWAPDHRPPKKNRRKIKNLFETTPSGAQCARIIK